MSDLTYLYVAYTVIWLGAVLYLVYIHSRQAGLHKQMDILLRRLERHGPKK